MPFCSVLGKGLTRSETQARTRRQVKPSSPQTGSTPFGICQDLPSWFPSRSPDSEEAPFRLTPPSLRLKSAPGAKYLGETNTWQLPFRFPRRTALRPPPTTSDHLRPPLRPFRASEARGVKYYHNFATGERMRQSPRRVPNTDDLGAEATAPTAQAGDGGAGSRDQVGVQRKMAGVSFGGPFKSNSNKGTRRMDAIFVGWCAIVFFLGSGRQTSG